MYLVYKKGSKMILADTLIKLSGAPIESENEQTELDKETEMIHQIQHVDIREDTFFAI